MPERLVSKARFAEMCGFTRGYVTALSKKKLKEADHGDSIDVAHSCVVDYLEKRSKRKPRIGKKWGRKRGTTNKKKTEPIKNDEGVFIPSEFIDYADWTIREVLTKFGTELQFNAFLKASKDISAIKLQELTIEKERGTLVSRDSVESVVFRSFETLFLRILADGSKTVSRKVHAMTKGGAEPEECEAEAKKINSRLLKTSKREIILGLKKI